MSSKIAFVEEASQPGANISAVCRKHGISRQSGYKFLRRFKKRGYAGLEEDSRRPKSTPLATAEDVVTAVIAARAKHPTFGPVKLVVVLRRTLGTLTPSERTVHRILERIGEIRRRKRKPRLSIVDTAPSVLAKRPNDVWTIDFKGWWRASDGARCEPLTIRDAFSRYVLAVVLLPKTTGERVRAVMTALFRKYGVPDVIQCDNGSPFISSQSLGGLTKLSAWWVSLGIRVVRSRPGCPQDNGGHERMHRDMATDLQADPASTMLLQQRACDRWRQMFNHVRPHAALSNKTPAEVFLSKTPKSQRQRRSARRGMRIIPTSYPMAWQKRIVACNGNIRIGGIDLFVSTALEGYQIGLEPLDGVTHRVWFYDNAVGEIELATVSATQVEQLAS